MGHDIERRIAAGEFTTHRSLRWTNDFGSQSFFRFKVLVIDFKLNPESDFRLGP